MDVSVVKKYPDPCLRIKTRQVDSFNGEIKKTLNLMADTMYLNQGIGLAATQVGLGSSFFVVDAGDGLISFVNPVIMERSKEKSTMEEGCLSLPGVTVNVRRPEKIKVRAQDKNGAYFVRNFEGLAAKAVQHEYDHLCGKLIVDYLDPIRYFLARRRLKSKKVKQTKRTCEVICHVGKEDTIGTKRGNEEPADD
ncbi:MAG: peptide deformylase [Candidatus Omnitrophota bacterium]